MPILDNCKLTISCSVDVSQKWQKRIIKIKSLDILIKINHANTNNIKSMSSLNSGSIVWNRSFNVNCQNFLGQIWSKLKVKSKSLPKTNVSNVTAERKYIKNNGSNLSTYLLFQMLQAARNFHKSLKFYLDKNIQETLNSFSQHGLSTINDWFVFCFS